ncbi:methionine aminopeptidase [Hyphomonas beringensis]|uniref:Methionine aminopeptidase n=2 Tax=Hyphomonas beringensis TaxID=1280946 RepID=A0A062U0Y3_9PROT|nr:type I methionyl aminopeptidase [Hyphomonas beringensis]KCZ53981.1 methionine aminopeptidase [Hyphomonas beringensis]
MMNDTALLLPMRTGEIRIHDAEGFEGMRKAGRLVAECMDMLVPEVKPGVTTEHLDNLVREYVLDHGAQSATIGYRGYRHATCISVNHVICHGIPSPKPLKEGDIANIDITVIIDGWHGDHSRMFGAGELKRKAERLVDVTYEAMMAGIAQIRPGRRFGDIGGAISEIAHKNRMSVVEDFCGHGLGKLFHDEPNVVHSAAYNTGPELKPGMFFTVEPMLNLGRKDANILPDGWTAVTRDRQLSAQYEHSVGVTEDGVEIFTTSPKGWHQPHKVKL